MAAVFQGQMASVPDFCCLFYYFFDRIFALQAGEGGVLLRVLALRSVFRGFVFGRCCILCQKTQEIAVLEGRNRFYAGESSP